jgi:rubrerythrin
MDVKERIDYDIKDEKKAKKDYRKLAQKLRSRGFKKEANWIVGISKNEAEHSRKLKKIRKVYAKVCK